MSRFPRRSVALLLTLLLAAGCARIQILESDPGEAAAEGASVVAHKARADSLTRQGKLPDALVQWRIVELLEPENAAAADQRRAVEAKIKRLVRDDLSAAREATSRRGRRAALLRVLANDPSNAEARERLQAIEVASIRRTRPKLAIKQAVKEERKRAYLAAQLAERSTAEPVSEPPAPGESLTETSQETTGTAAYQEAPLPDRGAKEAANVQLAAVPDREAENARLGSLAPAVDLAKEGQHLAAIPRLQAHLLRFPEDETALGLLATSHRKIGFAFYQDGNLRESVDHLKASENYAENSDPELQAALSDARSRLAQQAYEKGVKAFNSDLNQAIALWEESLKYDPAHIRARSYLDKAYKMQETLSGITTAE